MLYSKVSLQTSLLCKLPSIVVIVLIIALTTLVEISRAQSDNTQVAKIEDGRVYLSDTIILDIQRDAPGCFGTGKIAYSPTGEYFLVVIDCIEGDNEAFLFTADGSGKRRITGSSDFVNYYIYAWSPDGEWIVYQRVNSFGGAISSSSPRAGLVRYSVTSGEKLLLVSDFFAQTLSWSDDSQYIAFVAPNAATSETPLYVVTSDGSQIWEIHRYGFIDYRAILRWHDSDENYRALEFASDYLETPNTFAFSTSPDALSIGEPHTADSVLPYRVVDVESNDVLNIRSGPGVEHSLVGTIPPFGSNVRVVGSDVLVGNSMWTPIVYDGVNGWVNKRYLQPQLENYDGNLQNSITVWDVDPLDIPLSLIAVTPSTSSAQGNTETADLQESDATGVQDVRTLIDVNGRFNVPTAPLLRVDNEVVNNFYIDASYIYYESGSVIIEVGGNEMGYQTSFSFDSPGYGENIFRVTVFWSDREAAETAFLQRLGISEEVACRLNVVVQVLPVAGDLHTGEDSPLSFCPETHGGELAGEPVIVGNTVAEIVQSAVDLYQNAPELYQTYALADYIIDAAQRTASPVEHVCAAISSLNIIAPGNASLAKADFTCTWGQAVIIYAKTRTLLGLIPILLEPETYVDPWLDDVNELAWSMPMTCLIFPEFSLCQ